MARNRDGPRIGERDGTDALGYLFVLLALVLAGIHLYLGLAAPFVPGELVAPFVGIGAAFLLGAGLYGTRYWRPVLYLVEALFATVLGALWLFGGQPFFAIGVVTGVTATLFVVLAIYLFLREERASAESS